MYVKKNKNIFDYGTQISQQSGFILIYHKIFFNINLRFINYLLYLSSN